MIYSRRAPCPDRRWDAFHLPRTARPGPRGKVALSGLFGRFVARAYLERYFNLSIFMHLGSQTIDLDRRRSKSRVYREEIYRIGVPVRRICRRSPSLKQRDVTILEARPKLSPEFGLKPATST
ncbi:hypothetical protein J2W42_004251 [Rhizobium tibeticum]|nr:hypothetical protein [Rhizobium tibeticum]